MRTLWETLIVAFSMYSALPMPQVEWSRRNMRYALCAFPLVGATVGLLWLAALALALPPLLQGALLCLLPVWVTGGIHLDGYADTADALASHARPERRREILRDPHCGAFAVLRLCQYFVASFALCGVLERTPAAALCTGLSFVLSRTLSGLSVASFPISEDSGLARAFAEGADRTRVRRVLTVAAALLVLLLCVAGGWMGLAVSAAAGGVFWHFGHTVRTKFGGLSGDLAGWFLQRAELWMLAAVILVQMGEKLL